MRCWPGYQTDPQCLGQHPMEGTRCKTGQGQEVLILGAPQKGPHLPQNWSQALSPEATALVNDAIEKVWEQDRQRFMSANAFRLDNKLSEHPFAGIGKTSQLNASVQARIFRRGEARQEFWFCLSPADGPSGVVPHTKERYKVELSAPTGTARAPKQMKITHESATFAIPKEPPLEIDNQHVERASKPAFGFEFVDIFNLNQMKGRSGNLQ